MGMELCFTKERQKNIHQLPICPLIPLKRILIGAYGFIQFLIPNTSPPLFKHTINNIKLIESVKEHLLAALEAIRHDLGA